MSKHFVKLQCKMSFVCGLFEHIAAEMFVYLSFISMCVAHYNYHKAFKLGLSLNSSVYKRIQRNATKKGRTEKKALTTHIHRETYVFVCCHRVFAKTHQGKNERIKVVK